MWCGGAHPDVVRGSTPGCGVGEHGADYAWVRTTHGCGSRTGGRCLGVGALWEERGEREVRGRGAGGAWEVRGEPWEGVCARKRRALRAQKIKHFN